VLTPDGLGSAGGDGIAFPNGMAVTPDNSTLICAESYGKRLTAFDITAGRQPVEQRVWADLDDGVPDGICVDAEGAVWYGDVPNKRCVRVREGGEALETIELDRGCFACALGEQTKNALHVATQWSGAASMAERVTNGPGAGCPGARSGRRLAVRSGP